MLWSICNVTFQFSTYSGFRNPSVSKSVVDSSETLHCARARRWMWTVSWWTHLESQSFCCIPHNIKQWSTTLVCYSMYLHIQVSTYQWSRQCCTHCWTGRWVQSWGSLRRSKGGWLGVHPPSPDLQVDCCCCQCRGHHPRRQRSPEVMAVVLLTLVVALAVVQVPKVALAVLRQLYCWKELGRI